MAVLRSYAPTVEGSSRVCGPLPQQPVWLRHRARGGLLVSHGDYPHPDNWGVLLGCRFVASAATKPAVSSASSWAQYLPQATSGSHLSMNELQLPARAQVRAFCGFSNYLGEKGAKPGNRSSLVEGINILKGAMGKMKHNHPSSPDHKQAKHEMLEAILILEKFAADEHHYGNSSKARRLLIMVVRPLSSDLENHDIKDIVEASLRAMCLLLQNAPAEIGSDLCRTISEYKKLKTSLEKIQYCADKAGALAQKILAQLPSTPE